MVLVAAVLLATAVETPPPAPLQGVPARPYRLQVGDRVRFWPLPMSDLQREATVLRSDESALTIVRTDGEAELLPIASVSRLEVRRGSRHVGRGAIVGALAGGALYAFFRSDLDKGRRSERQVQHGAIAAAGGAVVGGMAGGTLSRPHWVPVDLGELPGLTQAPVLRLPLRITLRF